MQTTSGGQNRQEPESRGTFQEGGRLLFHQIRRRGNRSTTCGADQKVSKRYWPEARLSRPLHFYFRNDAGDRSFLQGLAVDFTAPSALGT